MSTETPATKIRTWPRRLALAAAFAATAGTSGLLGTAVGFIAGVSRSVKANVVSALDMGMSVAIPLNGSMGIEFDRTSLTTIFHHQGVGLQVCTSAQISAPGTGIAVKTHCDFLPETELAPPAPMPRSFPGPKRDA